MGMAASQARLLSITSRMSDNELRSQLINNAKMRLTSDSSKASEKYLAALNATQLMFSNYSLTGDSQYQQLTFNSLTAYSAYNNQYGLSNKGGELLVSELDSARFEEAFEKANADKSIEDGDIDGRNAKALEEFLKSYGLVKDTTYFEREALYTDIDKNIKNMYEGNMVFEYHADGPDGVPYAERVSGIHYGYEESLKSKDYGIYESLLNTYEATKSVWEAITLQSRSDYIQTLTSPYEPNAVYEGTFKDVLEWANGITTNYDENGNFEGFYDSDGNRLPDQNEPIRKAQEFQELMQDFYNQIYNDGIYTHTPTSVSENGANANRNGNSNASEDETDSFHRRMQFYLDLSGNSSTYKENPTQAYQREGFTPALIPMDEDGDGVIDYYYYEVNEANMPDQIVPLQKYPDQQVQTGTDADGNPVYGNVPVYEVVIRNMDQGEFVQSIVDMYRFFQGEVLNSIDENAALFKNAYIANGGTEAQYNKAHDDYYKAAKELSLFIYGQDVGSDYYDKLDDIEWILYGDYIDPADPSSGRSNAPLWPTTALDTSEGGVVYDMDFAIAGSLDKNDLPYPANFQVVKDVYLCEKMMELYGTPSYTWIDVNNRDENAEAKAEWYTNLFNRMLEGGYQTLENGLASSAEWLQFALESGLISMEQVNIKQQWVSTMYSNCSNITESQVDVDITIAEAEYNKTMSEIEAKDKRYDIELKNIDTEHQSLQTEYDSIKSVIDKNVERNFKMFEA